MELEWVAPPRDGGSKIIGYVVEKKQIGSEFWIRAHAQNIQDTNCKIDDLVENSEYEFRVKAINKAGESEPSSSSGRTKITEYPDGVKPEFTKKLTDLEGSIDGSVSFRAEFEAKPAPTVKWFKSGIEILPSSRFEIITESNSSVLIIKNLGDNDNNNPIGCQLINPLGRDSSEAILKIIGKVFLFNLKKKLTV